MFISIYLLHVHIILNGVLMNRIQPNINLEHLNKVRSRLPYKKIKFFLVSNTPDYINAIYIYQVYLILNKMGYLYHY